MKRAFGVILLVTVASTAEAHHGKDFLLVESYEVPHPGNLYLVTSGVLEVREERNAFEGEPSILLGVIPRLAFELHAHIAKEGDDSFRYEAIAPAIHAQLTPPDITFPIQVGLSVEYEIASSDSEEGDRLEGRLILEYPGPSKIAFDLIGERTEDGDTALGYAAGYRLEVSGPFAMGVEGQGRFDENAHEILAGVYYEPSSRFTIKGGVGTGLGPESPDATFRAGLVWGF